MSGGSGVQFVDESEKESAGEDSEGRLKLEDGRFVCAVEGCMAAAEKTASMKAHSSPAHKNSQAWKTGRDMSGDDDRSRGSDTASDRLGGGSGFGSGESGIMGSKRYETPTDILQSVLTNDPDVEPDEVEWILDSEEYLKVISPAELFETMVDFGINERIASRVKKRYENACNAAIDRNQYLQYEEEWAHLLQKVTGDPYMEWARQARAQGMVPSGGGSFGEGGINPAQMGMGMGNQQNQQGGQQKQSHSPSDAGVGGGGIRSPGAPPMMPNSGLHGPQNQGTDPDMERRFQELQRQQADMMRDLRDALQSDKDDSDSTEQLAKQIDKVNKVNERMQKLAGANDGDEQLRREMEQLREQVAQTVAEGGESGDSMTELVKLAADPENDIGSEDVSTFADAMGVTDSAVKEKEVEYKMKKLGIDARKDMVNSVVDSLSGVDWKNTGRAAKMFLEGVRGGDDGGDDRRYDMREQGQQPRQPPQQGHHQQQQSGVQTANPQHGHQQPQQPGQPQQQQGQPSQGYQQGSDIEYNEPQTPDNPSGRTPRAAMGSPGGADTGPPRRSGRTKKQGEPPEPPEGDPDPDSRARDGDDDDPEPREIEYNEPVTPDGTPPATEEDAEDAVEGALDEMREVEDMMDEVGDGIEDVTTDEDEGGDVDE